jgi:glycosyltransferase involved in cell wall biosynthesis
LRQYSLVIATLHDEGDLALCLQSLLEQQVAPWLEVIVVDQNGDDRLVSVLASFADRLTLVHKQVDFRGACRARNLGAHLATGEWLGFPDDDCELLPQTLREVTRIAQNRQVHVITGRTVDQDGNTNVLRWKDKAEQFDRWTMFGCLTEATLFVRRDLFLKAGGFDERFGPGAQFPAAEGIDLMNRVFEQIGAGIAFYSPHVIMRHPTKIPPWNRWAVSRFHQYAIGDGALIAKTPRMHMLFWGARTLVAALLQVLTFNRWRSMAFAARVVGLAKGFVAFHRSSNRV